MNQQRKSIGAFLGSASELSRLNPTLNPDPKHSAYKRSHSTLADISRIVLETNMEPKTGPINSLLSFVKMSP